MRKLNWTLIAYNLAEAREQLEAIEAQVKAGNPPGEIEFQIKLEHACHHLNFAWNVRRQPTEKYTNLSRKDFNRWSKFPKVMKASKNTKQK